jgi:hypothetical protein
MNEIFFAVAAVVGAGGVEGGAPAPISWWLIVIPAAVPLVIAVVKVLVPKVPKTWLPILAPVLGALAEFLVTGTFDQGTLLGAIAGSAGVGLREIVDQLRKRADSASG